MPDFVGLLKKGFPIISAFASFGGPLGTMAASAVGNALGVDKVGSSHDAIAAAIAGATPEQMVQLKQAEADMQVKLQQMGFAHAEELEKLAVEDRESARNLQISTKGRTAPILAWIIVLSFVAACGAILHGWAKVDSVMAGTLVGYLAANSNQVISYFFGSSAGSDRKTELLASK